VRAGALLADRLALESAKRSGHVLPTVAAASWAASSISAAPGIPAASASLAVFSCWIAACRATDSAAARSGGSFATFNAARAVRTLVIGASERNSTAISLKPAESSVSGANRRAAESASA
jgi:hypothetical protein